jgi:MSHA biogenesis protein MshG
MPIFKYRGRDPEGKEILGTIDATTEKAVAAVLTNQRIIPVEIVETEADSKGFSFSFTRPRVTVDEQVMLCRQLNSLLKAGVPTVQAINGLALSSANPALSDSLFKVEQALEMGTPLANALKQQPKVYGPLFVAMVHVGENTGRLDEAFKKLSDYLELERNTRKKVTQATRYPKMVVGAITAAMVVINIVVVPQFAQLFAKFGSELPLPTKILMATSDLFVNWWWAMLLVVGGLIFAFTRYLDTIEGRLKWDQQLMKMPIIGPIFEKITLGRFSRTFAMTYKAGLPILQSLSVVAKAVSNSYVEQSINGMRAGIERGDSFTRTSTAAGLFSPLVLQMINVGEQTGSLDSLLDEVADFYEQEVDYDLSKLSEAIQPILLVFMGGMVLMLALGVFLPMWDMFALIQK